MCVFACVHSPSCVVYARLCEDVGGVGTCIGACVPLFAHMDGRRTEGKKRTITMQPLFPIGTAMYIFQVGQPASQPAPPLKGSDLD